MIGIQISITAAAASLQILAPALHSFLRGRQADGSTTMMRGKQQDGSYAILSGKEA